MTATLPAARLGEHEWTLLFALIKATWPASQLPVATAAAWYPHLARFDPRTVRAAVLRLGAEHTFAPSVSELVAACTPRPVATPAECDCGDPNCRCRIAGLCEGGWAFSRQDGYEVVTPCRHCRPAAHQLWAFGHWSCPNRRKCGVCKPIVENGVR